MNGHDHGSCGQAHNHTAGANAKMIGWATPAVRADQLRTHARDCDGQTSHQSMINKKSEIPLLPLRNHPKKSLQNRLLICT